jgi:hypothetical protein
MQGIQYSVDIVFVIDATGSMGNLIHKVKSNALLFEQDLQDRMREKNKIINHLRVRVVWYRDFYCDGIYAFGESDFFELPAEKEHFARFVNAIYADGGGDEPENGLEALAVAIRSNWTREANKRRQIIVLWTDATAHLLEAFKDEKPENYPPNMPASLNELTDWWEGDEYVSMAGKRLILFAPELFPWTEVSNHWNNVVHFPSLAGEGLDDIDYQTILDAIANSV